MKRSRRGIALLESVVAAGLLLVLSAVAVQMLSTAAAGRRALDRRALAIGETANLAERITVMPWDTITTSGLAGVELSATAKQQLPKSELKLAVEPASSLPSLKRVTVEISWRETGDVVARPARLSFWVSAPAGRSEP